MTKKQERLDKIMAACRERMQEEVSALLGKAITFAEPETKVLSKEDFFSEPAGKSVLAHVQLEGDVEGQGCLLVPVRDAIRIGGTLIMLPDSELESVISEEEYTEELEDSYGEIANIICGSLTTTFEEQYPKSFRLVRTEQEVILPVKVDIESDEPVPDGMYYLMTTAMALEDAEMGKMQLLLPAASFGLVEEPQQAGEPEAGQAAVNNANVDTETETSGNGQPEVIERSPAAAAEQPQSIDRAKAEDQTDAPSPAAVKKKSIDVEKQKERIDQLLANCLDKVGEEVGALLGGTLKVIAEENAVLDKEALLEQAGGKQVMARMDVRGEGEGESYLFVSLKDAIFLGGTLIMLPDAELEEVVRNEEFGEDAEDAYGEIANIIAGVYTSVFEEQYRKTLGFVKTGLETVIPIKIDPDSDDVIPRGIYYLNSGTIHYNDQELGRLQMAFPAALFELEALAVGDIEEEPGIEESTAATLGSPEAQSNSTAQPLRQAATSPGGGPANSRTEAAGGTGGTDILLFTDDDAEAGAIVDILADQGYASRLLHYRDAVTDYLSPAVSLVFLVMQEVNEQGFGMAIKLSSSGLQAPLVMAGPAWTRTTVLKAVKYGATDILITPASVEDVVEKLKNNLVKKAA